MLQLTFRSIDLVTTDGHQINLAVWDIDGNLSNSLSSISVKEDSFRTTKLTCEKKGQKIGFDQNTETWIFQKYDFWLMWGVRKEVPWLLISLMGCFTPISLLTVITDISEVSGRMEASTSWTHRCTLFSIHTVTFVCCSYDFVVHLGDIPPGLAVRSP